jgi:hypothetical protein
MVWAVDQTPIRGVADKIEAVSIIYMAHFIFNLSYHADAQITLEFIQRYAF